MTGFECRYGAEMRDLAEGLLRFDTTGGGERPAQEWFRDRLADLGFETYTWEVDPEVLEAHPSFGPLGDVADRPNVAGILEFGEPAEGPTLVLNGHMDVVPATDAHWTGDPFEPRWEDDRLVARGAADMKSQLAACVAAARSLREASADLDGRVVVESVVGEEEGGLGAATAAASNPYPFARDAAIVAEPTDTRVVTATEGCLMVRLTIEGRAAHAARKWEGESVLPRFERVRRAFEELEADRAERVSHPLYERFDVPWPIVIGRVEAGTWASNVPDTLMADLRVGVAPGESTESVRRECEERLAELAAADDWLAAHPPTVERLGHQFEPAEIDPDEPVVAALRAGMEACGIDDTAPRGETYGSDARHYVEAGIPTVVFGPGRIEEAHFPDESIRWPDVVAAAEVLGETARRFLAS